MSEVGRRWRDGMTLRIPGPAFDLEYRVVDGAKAAGDLRLDWRVVTPWQAVILDHVAVIVDAIGENEALLYPPPASGNAKVVAFVLAAMRDGQVKARNELYLDRQRRHER